MIAEAAIMAGSQHTDVVGAARAYIAESRLVAADGLTWAEFGELLIGLLRLTVDIVDVMSAPGADKKAMVLAAAAALFDAVADRTVPAWAYPFWITVRSPMRAIVLAIASGAIEQILPLVRATA